MSLEDSTSYWIGQFHGLSTETSIQVFQTNEEYDEDGLGYLIVVEDCQARVSKMFHTLGNNLEVF